MDLDRLRQKLIAAARSHPPDDGVPYAFERRIMARLRAQTSVDPWSAWGSGLWRAAAPCVAVMCATTVWAFVSGDLLGSDRSLAIDLESTVLAPLANFEETW